MKQKSGGLMGWFRRARRWVIVLLVGAMLAVGTGCFGSFPLTHTIYTMNGSIEPGVLRQVVFWVFAILPVYNAGILADAVLLNLLEFWFDADFGGFGQSAGDPEMDVSMTTIEEGRVAELSIARDGKVVTRARFVRISDDRCEVRSTDGKLMGSAVRAEDGSLRLQDRDGTVVADLGSEQVGELMRSAQ